jgi:GNAT superfamily N-acetyltransferase
MSGSAPIEAGVGAGGAGSGSSSWHVRLAGDHDVSTVAAAVGELLVELGGAPPAAPAMETAVLALLDDREAGAVLVAEAGCAESETGIEAGIVASSGAIVGVLGASWQSAIHIPGRYALIQDLWVRPSWRGAGVGGGLLAALVELADEREVACIEVGLPRARFAGLAATEAFYRANGFAPLGTRMRRGLL